MSVFFKPKHLKRLFKVDADHTRTEREKIVSLKCWHLDTWIMTSATVFDDGLVVVDKIEALDGQLVVAALKNLSKPAKILIGSGFDQYIRHHLDAGGIAYTSLSLAGRCFSKVDADNFSDKKSAAYFKLIDAVKAEKFKVGVTGKNKPIQRKQIIEQLGGVLFYFDDRARYKMYSYEQRRSMRLATLEIANTFAQIYAEGVT